MQIIFLRKESYHFPKEYLIFKAISTERKAHGNLSSCRVGTQLEFSLRSGSRTPLRSVFIEGNTENLGMCYQFGN